MEKPFVCSQCAGEHLDPAEATLGHVVICLECAIGRGLEMVRPERTLGTHQEAA